MINGVPWRDEKWLRVSKMSPTYEYNPSRGGKLGQGDLGLAHVKSSQVKEVRLRLVLMLSRRHNGGGEGSVVLSRR